MSDVKVGDLIYFTEIPFGEWNTGLVIQFFPAKSKKRAVAERSICYVILRGETILWLSFEELNWKPE